MSALLELEGVTRRFGGLNAVEGVSFSVAQGEIVGLIGPNGAGKTTLIDVITGVHPANHGRVRFDGQDITHRRPHQIARLGLARTFQIVQPFPKMTVLENAAAGALFSGGASSVHDAYAAARQQLEFTGLADLTDRPAATLTLARRKRLELAKSLAMKPRLLMLDEVNGRSQCGRNCGGARANPRDRKPRRHHHRDRASDAGRPFGLAPFGRVAPWATDRPGSAARGRQR
jgi:branched-chain amino acid transport system ATP-binding protein